MRNECIMRPFAALFAAVFLAGAIHAEDVSVFEAREALAKLQAMDIFPDMEKEDSEFADAVSTEVECLECEEPTFFKSPAWPLRAARRVAARLGVKPRTVAEIRKHVARSFELDADAFQQVHGIQILLARLTVGGEEFDVMPQMAARVTGEGFKVDCDGSLVAMLADESMAARNTDEKAADYWKRQRRQLAAVTSARPGQEVLQITFEFQSESFTASVKSGERLAISEEGKVSIGKIAPAARAMTGAAPGEKSSPAPRKVSKPSPPVSANGPMPKPEPRRPPVPPLNRR